jgi:excisionase family DNA binding protein
MSESRTRHLAAQAVAHLPSLCTLRETAEALRTSTRNVQRWIAIGLLPAARMRPCGGSRVLIPRSSIEALLARSLTGSPDSVLRR